ncbi:mucin-17 [Biomphalaria glabrata]|nr:mucin-17 [Biomphalaria glabrata]
MVLYLTNTGWMKRNLHNIVIISLFGLLRIATGQQTDGNTTASLNPSLSTTTLSEEPKLSDILISSDVQVVSSADTNNDYLSTQSVYYTDTIATSSFEVSKDIITTFNLESSIQSISTDIIASNLESSSQPNTLSIESSIQSNLESTIQYFTTQYITTFNLQSSIKAASTDFITTSSLDLNVQPIITETVTTTNFNSSIQSFDTYNLTPSSLESSMQAISASIFTTISLESTMQQTKTDTITAFSLESSIQSISADISATLSLESNIQSISEDISTTLSLESTIPSDSCVTSSIEPSEITTSSSPYNSDSTSTIDQLTIDSTVYPTQLTSSLFYSPSTITSDTDLWSSLTNIHTLESFYVSHSLDTLPANSIFSLEPTPLTTDASPLVYDSFSAQITQGLSSSGTEIFSSTTADILLTEAHSDVSSTVESMASLFLTSSFLDVTSIAKSSDLISGSALTDVSLMPDSSVDMETTIRITLSEMMTASMTSMLEISPIETYVIENDTSALTPGMDTSIYASDSVMSQSITLSLTDTSTLINPVPKSSVLVTDDTVSPEETWSESVSITVSLSDVMTVSTSLVRPDMVPSLSDAPSTDLSIVTSMPNDMSSSSMFTDPFQLTLVSSFSTRLPIISLSTELVATSDSTISYSPPLDHTTTEGLDTSRIDILLVSSSMNFISSLTELTVTTSNMEVSSLFGISTEQQTSSVQTSSMNDFTDAFNTSTEKLTATLTTSIISFHSVSSQLSEELIVLNSPSVDFSTVSSTYTETLTEVSSFVDFPRTSRIALESFSQTEMDDSKTGFSGVSSTFSAELMESIISSSGFSSAYSFSKNERTDFDLFSSSAYSSSEERPVITITKLVTDFMSNVTIRSQSLSTLLSVDTDNETVHLEVTSDYDFTHDLHPTTLISDVHFSSSVTILGVVDTWYSSVLSVGSSRVLEPTSTLELDVSSTLSSSYILFEDLSNASLSYTSASQSSLTMLVLTSFSYASDAIANITSDMRTDVHPGDVVLSSSNSIISDTVSPTLTEHYLTQILSTLWPSFSESSSLIAVSYYYSSVSAMETLSATLDVPVYSSENVSTEIKASWTDDISGTSQFLSFSTYIIHTSNLMDFSTSFLTSRPISITSEWSLEYSDPVPSSADVTLSVINSSQSTVEDTPDSFLVSPEIVSPSVKSTDMMSVETLYTTLDSSQVYQDLQTQDIITSGQDFFTTFSHSEIFMNFSDDSSSKFVLSSMPSYTPTESMSLSKSLSELQSLEEVSISISTFLMSLSPGSSSRTSDYRESLTTAAVESSPSIVTNTFFPSYLASDVSAVQESYPTSVNQTEEWTIYTDLISSVGHLPSQTSLNPLIPLTTVALDPSLPGENLTVAGTSTLSASNLFVASRTDFSDSESMVESISSMTSTVQFLSTMAEYSLTTSMVSVLSVETVLTSMQPHQSEITLSYNDTDSSIISWSASKEIPLESSHFLESSYISDRASSNISDLTSYISDMASYTSDMTSYISDRASSNISDMTSSYISDMTSYTSDMTSYTSDMTSYTSDMTSYTSDMTSYTSDMTPYISDWASSNISDWASSNISDMTSSYISDMTSYTSDMTSYISDMTSYISDMTSSYISDMTSAYISDMTSYTTDMTSYTSNMTSYTSDIISYISDRTSSNISDMTSAYISDMTSHTFNDLSSLVSSPFPEGTSAFTEYITFHISTDTSSVTMSDITLSTSLTSDYFSPLNTSSVSLYPTVQDSSYYTLSEVSTSKSLFPDLLTSSFTIQSIWPSSVNWTDTSVGSMSSSLSDITLTFSNSISESLNWSISTGGFIEPTLTYTDSISTTEVVIQNSSSLLIVTSVTSEFTLSPTTLSSVLPSSSIIPTVPPTTGPTVPNIENSKNKTEFWVVTKFKVRPSVDIQAREFKNGLEKGLANAYALSKIRNEEKINGTYVPLKKRKRASVADMDNTVQVEIVSLTRPDTLTVDATYVVQENGQIVPAQQVSDQLNLLSSQEMAIQTGQVVTQTAQPYITPASSEDNTKWIILGSVLGGVLVLAIFFFILCCCCGRCCQAKGKDNQVAMEAVKVVYISLVISLCSSCCQSKQSGNVSH